MTQRRVSRLPSLKAPSPSIRDSLSPVPPNSAGQTRSRRTSVSTNSDNGSLGRDVHLSDFAFVEQLEDFRRQLLDLRKDKKKLEDEIIKYKLLCKEKHQSIQDLNNKIDAEKANAYDLKEQLTRDLSLQFSNQHASEKKKLNFDISILKNDKRKLESEIRLLETTNKGLFEEIRQIRSSYDAKMEKLMKDFHIEIYKESGEKRKLEKKLQESNEKLTKEEYLAKQMELEKDRAEYEAYAIKNRRMSVIPDYGGLDKQNKKIAELEQQLRKLESLKTITENQNIDLQKRLKDQEKQLKSNSLQRKAKPTDNDRNNERNNDRNNEKETSPGTERRLRGAAGLSKYSSKDKVDAAEKKIGSKDGKVSKKDLESFLKLANKEKNVLERKIALLEKARQQTGDEKMDNEVAALRQQHNALLENISAKEKLLSDSDESTTPDDKKRKVQPSTAGLKPPPKTGIPKSPKTSRRMSRSPSPLLHQLREDSGDQNYKDTERKKISEKKKLKIVDQPNVETAEKEQQTAGIEQRDEEIQVEFFDEDGEVFDGPDFENVHGINMDGGGAFMFQEPDFEDHSGFVPGDAGLGTHSKDTVVNELEEKICQLEDARSKDMEKINHMGVMLDKSKQEIAALNRKAGAYYNELEESQNKLNSSFQNIEKLNEKIKDLQSLNTSLQEEQSYEAAAGAVLSGDTEKELKDAKDEVERMNNELREKQLTVMKLHQELHEASEQALDKGSMVRQLEVVVENLRHDNELMREEQMSAETTNEEVLDKLRMYQMRSNQLEEIVKTLEHDIETHKRDTVKMTEENEKLQAEKERLEVEADDQSAKIAARESELESILSDNPNSESSQQSLELLQEVRHKDNSLKKMHKKHEDTLKTLKKEVEKQVGDLQNKVSRREDELADSKAQFNQDKAGLLSQISDLQREIENVRENLTEKEQELSEVYDTIKHDKTNSMEKNNSSVDMKEMNKRLAELANENMTLRDQLSEYMKMMKEKRPAGFMGELGQRIQTQRPSFTGTAPKLTLTDGDKSCDELLEEDEDIGEISVALVLYSYDPAAMSPNDYPEDELSLSSGEFIYIFGDPDVDGFYTAELMSGQRGLVPSNFIQIVELTEKKTQQMRRMSLAMAQNTASPPQPTTLTKNKDIPVPCNIQCESIGTKTVQCFWEMQDTGAIVPILGFRICINNQEFKSTTTGECRTVLKDLPAGRPLYITIATLSPLGDGVESEPCIFGRETMKAPQSLDVTNITTHSAVVTFVGQPHYYHSVFVNGAHSAHLKPGASVYHLKGLESDTEYEIRIVSLPDSKTPDNQTFICSQSTCFLTEIEGPLRSPTSSVTSPTLSTSLTSPNNIQLSILDKQNLKLSWSNVPCASSYQIYVNDYLEEEGITDNNKIIMLNNLNHLQDEQNFHVIAVGDNNQISEPSETISFYKSQLLSHLSDFCKENRHVDNKINENNHNITNHNTNCHQNHLNHQNKHYTLNDFDKDIQTKISPTNIISTPNKPIISLSEYFDTESSALLNIRPKIIGRVLQQYHLNEKHTLNQNQLICVERETDGMFVACLQGDELRYNIPEHLITPVPTIKKVVALYEYVPQKMSPNSDCYNELSFKTGDVILIFEEEQDGLFYKGILDNVVGLVPSNFVIDLEAVIQYAHSAEDNLSSFESNDQNIPVIDCNS